MVNLLPAMTRLSSAEICKTERRVAGKEKNRLAVRLSSLYETASRVQVMTADSSLWWLSPVPRLRIQSLSFPVATDSDSEVGTEPP